MPELDAFSAETSDPLNLFHNWFEQASLREATDPNAMSLATATPQGVPSVRIVLMKQFDERGFTFFTNRDSRKGQELTANPYAALCFHWKTLQRQIRVEGSIREVNAVEADDYFHSRARISQIGAWASQQSRPLADRATLESRTQHYEALYPSEIPRPEYWTGFLLSPRFIEFWQDRPFRLHDRVLFQKDNGLWSKQRLYP